MSRATAPSRRRVPIRRRVSAGARRAADGADVRAMAAVRRARARGGGARLRPAPAAPPRGGRGADRGRRAPRTNAERCARRYCCRRRAAAAAGDATALRAATLWAEATDARAAARACATRTWRAPPADAQWRRYAVAIRHVLRAAHDAKQRPASESEEARGAAPSKRPCAFVAAAAAVAASRRARASRPPRPRRARRSCARSCARRPPRRRHRRRPRPNRARRPSRPPSRPRPEIARRAHPWGPPPAAAAAAQATAGPHVRRRPRRASPAAAATGPTPWHHRHSERRRGLVRKAPGPRVWKDARSARDAAVRDARSSSEKQAARRWRTPGRAEEGPPWLYGRVALRSAHAAHS